MTFVRFTLLNQLGLIRCFSSAPLRHYFLSILKRSEQFNKQISPEKRHRVRVKERRVARQEKFRFLRNLFSYNTRERTRGASWRIPDIVGIYLNKYTRIESIPVFLDPLDPQAPPRCRTSKIRCSDKLLFARLSSSTCTYSISYVHMWKYIRVRVRVEWSTLI